MAYVSWLICCGEFNIKEDNLCDAKNMVVEIRTTQLPAMVRIPLDIAALFRTDDPGAEAPLDIRVAVLGADNSLSPSEATWRIRFDDMQVLWGARIDQLYIPCSGFTSLIIQGMEEGEWRQKGAYTFMAIAENEEEAEA